MKRVAIPIETAELCSYGCGCVAKFKNGSNKLMCLERSNSCPAVRKKNSEKIKKAHEEGRLVGWDITRSYNHGWSKGLTAETDSRVAKAKATMRKKIDSGEFTPYKIVHTVETKAKISKARTEWLRNPENRKNLGRGKQSWMEQCFQKWLEDSSIGGWETEKHFWNPICRKNYYCDFVFEDIKLIIELDGNQHLKTIEQDKIRDDWLHTVGYRVVRIQHKEFKERFFSNKGFEDLLRH
jgi:very-short-patch-repair endonuclease